MESTSLLPTEAEARPASPGRTSRVAGVVVAACATLGVVAAVARSSLRSPASTAPVAELYKKKEVYGPDYGTLLGDDLLQKAWPGLTCERSDDDKWGWATDAMAQPLDSGTNCVYGDTDFCTRHFIKYDGGTERFDGLMKDVSMLMWNRCNATCNATDEQQLAIAGVDAHLKGTSGLAVCQFEGITEMQEVCTGVPEKFKMYSRHRYLEAKRNRRLMSNNPPSVPYRNMTNILINQTYSQESCNTHAFCGVCVTDGVVDRYCNAFLYYYSIKYTTFYNAALFWYSYVLSVCLSVSCSRRVARCQTFDSPHSQARIDSVTPARFCLRLRYNVHFWCMDEVLDSIEDGTFIDKVESGEIPSNDEIETAWTNQQAISKYGTWHVPTDDNYTYDYVDDDDYIKDD